MNKRNSIAPQEEVNKEQPATARNLGPASASNILSYLFSRAEGTFDADELKWLSRAGEVARFMAGQLGASVANIGCLIDSDYQPGQLRAGNFESGSNVAQLLYTIADQVNVIGELANIGSECDFALRQMGVKGV